MTVQANAIVFLVTVTEPRSIFFWLYLSSVVKSDEASEKKQGKGKKVWIWKGKAFNQLHIYRQKSPIKKFLESS